MWAFQGGITTNVTTKQLDWTGLDRVVNAAKKNGVKLILVLSDQAGKCDDGHWKDISWYSQGYTQSFDDYGNGLAPLPYFEYVKLVVDRYKDSTAVAMWEPVNEPIAANCIDAKGDGCFAKQTCYDEVAATNALRSFFDVVGGEIKRIDKNHLVSSGLIGDGQCGAVFEDYKYVHESPGIDVASYHDYSRESEPIPGDPWNGLQKRLDQMKSINKPLIVGEVGMLAVNNSPNCVSYDTRRDKLKAKMDAQFAAGIAGFLPWSLTNGASNGCNYDIVYDDPTIALLHDYPVSMGAYVDKQSPTSPINLTAVAISPTQVKLSWNASTDNVGVTKYDIVRNNKFLVSTKNTTFTNVYLNPSTSYTYYLIAKDSANNASRWSTKVTIIPVPPPTPTPTPTPTPLPPDTQAPSAPVDLKATVVSSTQVNLTWTASTDNVGVTKYDIFRNDQYFTSTTDTKLTNSNLIPSTSYTYHVKGKDAANNNSAASNKVTVTTAAP